MVGETHVTRENRQRVLVFIASLKFNLLPVIFLAALLWSFTPYEIIKWAYMDVNLGEWIVSGGGYWKR